MINLIPVVDPSCLVLIGRKMGQGFRHVLNGYRALANIYLTDSGTFTVR